MFSSRYTAVRFSAVSSASRFHGTPLRSAASSLFTSLGLWALLVTSHLATPRQDCRLPHHLLLHCTTISAWNKFFAGTTLSVSTLCGYYHSSTATALCAACTWNWILQTFCCTPRTRAAHTALHSGEHAPPRLWNSPLKTTLPFSSGTPHAQVWVTLAQILPRAGFALANTPLNNHHHHAGISFTRTLAFALLRLSLCRFHSHHCVIVFCRSLCASWSSSLRALLPFCAP